MFKAVRGVEMRMFIEMGHAYFEYMCKSFLHYSPTAIAKILGAYKIKIRVNGKNPDTYFIFVMENIIINIDEKNNDIIKYDLKGSRRKRFIEKPKPGQVMLDNNFLFNYNSKPICMNYVMKRLL